MKRRTWVILVAVVVLVAVLAAGVVGIIHLLQNRPGVHVKDGTAQVNLELPCYIYNCNTGSFEEMSTVTWKMPKSPISDQEYKGYGRDVEAEKVLFSVDVADDILTDKAHPIKGYLRLYEDHLIYAGSVLDYEYPQKEDGSFTIKPEFKVTYYASYDLTTEQLCVQIVTEEGVLVGLAGFESQEEAEKYLQGEGRSWVEEIYYEIHHANTEAEEP